MTSNTFHKLLYVVIMFKLKQINELVTLETLYSRLSVRTILKKEMVMEEQNLLSQILYHT